MTSRVYHALAGLQWEVGAIDQAFGHIRQALVISHEIGYSPGIAHGLVAPGELESQCGDLNVAREHFQEAMTCCLLLTLFPPAT